MKNIKPFYTINEAESGSRERAKAAVAAFDKAQLELGDLYQKMRDLSREIDSSYRMLRSEGDHEAADAVEKAFGSVEGSFLYSLKDAMKYKAKTEAVAALGRFEKNETLKAPKILNINDEDFSAFVAFLKSKFKGGASHVGHQHGYGISVGNNPNPSGWSSDNSTNKYERIMSNIRMALQGDEREVKKTEVDLGDVNRQLAPFGFGVVKIYKDPYTKQIVFKKT